MYKLLPLFLLASIAGGEVFKVITPNYEFKDNRIRIEGYGSLLEPGAPWMPAKAVWIIVPPGAEITNCKVRRNLHSVVDKYSIGLAPNKLTEGSILEKGLEDVKISILEDYYPSTADECLGIHKFMGYELAKVIVFPFAYNPKTKELWYSPNITININYTTPGKSVEVDTTFDDILQETVLNFTQKNKWYKPSADDHSSPDYIIIAERKLIPMLRDFIEWKESIGYKVKVISHNRLKEIGNPKYVLVIGKPIETQNSKLQNYIVGRIPYTEPNLVSSILERTIEFELNSKKKRILFVRGIANYENENYSEFPAEDKSTLMRKLESLIPMDWEFEEYSGEEIQGDYSIINFLSSGKNWVGDDGDGVPEEEEIRISSYSLFNVSPCLVFSPFSGAKFLKEGAVCVIAPKSSSHYIVGWDDPSDGGNQSFNYGFLKYLMAKEIVGDAFCSAKFWYETYFPYDTLNFEICGDPSLNLHGIPAVDIGIISIPGKWIPPDTEYSLICKVLNLGRITETNCKLYCEIDSSGVKIYSQLAMIDTINPDEEKLIEFPKWNNYQPGVGYKVQFGLFSTRDENPQNDTLSTTAYVAEGDFIVWDAGTPYSSPLHTVLTELGYRGVWISDSAEYKSLFPWINNFSSIFISDIENIDSFPPVPNIYIEGSNIWLSNLLTGKKLKTPMGASISGMGFSFNSSVEREWFIPNNCTPIFTDSHGEIAGFCYSSGDDYPKIWCTRFKLSEIDKFLIAPLIDSIMHFFKITSTHELSPGVESSNITLFESLPNPFHHKTCVKLKIENKPCKLNLSVYNLAGTRIKELLNGSLTPGEYEIFWDASDDNVVNGIYFLRLQTEEESKLIKLIVFK